MIAKRIKESIQVKEKVLNNDLLQQEIEQAINIITKSLKAGGKVLFCGNGGSAADAQHLAAELSGRFYFDRAPLNAEACHVNTSFITAVANDYSFDEVYARYVKSTGKKGDILIGLTTSGNSENIIKAFQSGKELEMHLIAFTGETGGKIKAITDFLINVPSNDTPRIQEAHILIGHIICEFVEKNIFSNEK